jgi:lipoyl(octanoyl) transferase
VTTGERRPLRGVWLGARPYEPILDLQERLCSARADGLIEDTVLFLEHTPVVTLGRGADPSHLLLGKEALGARGIDCVVTNRGGDVTLHAPGQLVAYPIVDLRPDRCDVRRYVRDLTEVMRRLALRHGVASGTVPGLIGLWVDPTNPAEFPGPEQARALAKVGAVGVRISRWVTMHGFALNLTMDTSLFGLIVPCGIREHGVTSVLELTGRRPDAHEEAEAALGILGELLGSDPSDLADFGDASLDAVSDLLRGRRTPPSATRTAL